MTALIVAAALVLSAEPPAESFVPFKMPPIRLSVPSSWAHSQDEASHRFSAPDGEGYFVVDVGEVQTAGMKAEECRKKITKAIGGRFQQLTLGGKPAAKKVTVDKDKTKKEFVTILYVGCDGATTWSMSFHTVKAKQQAHAEVAEKVASTLEFLKPAGG